MVSENTLEERIDMNMATIFQIQEEEKLEIPLKERNATFDCLICLEKKKIEENSITLECEHRFCRDCRQSDIITKMKDKKVTENDIKCFI